MKTKKKDEDYLQVTILITEEIKKIIRVPTNVKGTSGKTIPQICL